MNSKWLGDSFDLVKRVLLEAVAETGLEVFADPMLTDKDVNIPNDYFRLINAKQVLPDGQITSGRCLFLDPDTGISGKKGKSHITVKDISRNLSLGYDLVVVFDQSFSRNSDIIKSINDKLEVLDKEGVKGFYYNSHANFLFASAQKDILKKVMNSLLEIGIPSDRLISC
jgi:hypothetical protein